MTTYTLSSTPMCCTPGLVRWAQNGAKFKKDRPVMRRVLMEGYGLPERAADAILDGKCEIDDANEVVTVSIDETPSFLAPSNIEAPHPSVIEEWKAENGHGPRPIRHEDTAGTNIHEFVETMQDIGFNVLTFD